MATARVENARRTVRFRPKQVLTPATRDELCTIVKAVSDRGGRIKAVGGGHSFNHIFRTDDTLVDLRRLNRIIAVDPQTHIVEAEAGMTLGDAIVAFDAQGVHFPSLGSWHSQSLAGAIATATHGSSLMHGSLSDAVLALEAVLADGSVIAPAGDDERLKAFRCHLGQLGIVTKVTLQLGRAFWLESRIRIMPDREGFDTAVAEAREHEYVNLLWLPYRDEVCLRTLHRTPHRRRNQAAIDLERAFTDQSRFRHRLQDLGIFLAGHAYLRQPRRLTRWYGAKVRSAFVEDDGVVDKSYRLFLYDQYREPTENHQLRTILNAEYALDLAEVEPALTAMKAVIERYRAQGRYINYPRIHLRFAPGTDRTLIGLNAGRNTGYIGIYIVGSIRHRPQIEIAEALERAMADRGGRPHWGKYRYLDDRGFEASYPRLARFQAVRAELDPTGVFSDGWEMFRGLDRFRAPKLGRMLGSLLNPHEYQRIRLL